MLFSLKTGDEVGSEERVVLSALPWVATPCGLVGDTDVAEEHTAFIFRDAE